MRRKICIVIVLSVTLLSLILYSYHIKIQQLQETIMLWGPTGSAAAISTGNAAGIYTVSAHTKPAQTNSPAGNKESNGAVATNLAGNTKYIEAEFQGRLGNLLFIYASLLGIARKNNLVPLVPGKNKLRTIFTLSVEASERHQVTFPRKFEERKGGCTFDGRAMSLGNAVNVHLKGYYQSWKYFLDIAPVIRQELKFQNNLGQAAKIQFFDIIGNVSAKTTFIAIHVRRGDMVSGKVFVDYGYNVAPVTYFHKAMDLFRANYSQPIFLVASDDIPWCQKHFPGEDVRFIKQHNTPEMDMAIMRNCNHMIVSVGSFGWWTAWMIDGTTVYYKDYPKANSKLAAEFTSADYRPPHWIGLGD